MTKTRRGSPAVTPVGKAVDRQREVVEWMETKLTRIAELERKRNALSKRNLSRSVDIGDDADNEEGLNLLITKETNELGSMFLQAVKLGLSLKHYLENYYP